MSDIKMRRVNAGAGLLILKFVLQDRGIQEGAQKAADGLAELDRQTAALCQIADGHPDPQRLARDVLGEDG